MCLYRVIFEVFAKWRLLYQYRKHISKFWNEVLTKEVRLAMMSIVSIIDKGAL